MSRREVSLNFEVRFDFCAKVISLDNLLSQPEFIHTTDIQILLSLASLSSGSGSKPVFAWIMW